MSKTTLGFIFSGLLYLVAGIALGVLFLAVPSTTKLRTVHVHANLVGFVIFLIIGVGYHILPRFRGRPLHSESLGWLGLWLANIGLAGMLVTDGLISYEAISDGRYAQVFFGSLLGLSIYVFVYNILRTLTAPAPQAAARPTAPPVGKR